uniref:Integrase catalytic domain-containing protein n=1 Tax=Bombyx mori TaxID=7091 RepID=A0A8R2R568_BOMMO|nr:uncharacterized protein LOC119630464 [Bombyx mori]
MDKLELQSTCFENIKTLCTNYRKDSSSRKTEEYLNIRLSSLEEQWRDFEARNALLLLELEDKTIHYFSEDVYNKTKEMYLATKTDINNRLKYLKQQKHSVNFDLSDISVDYTQDCEDGKSEKIQQLLNKQECNFNAICHALSKIDIIRTSEKWELEDNFNILKSKWESIDKLHWEIDFQLKGSNDHYYRMYSDMEEKYDELRKQLQSKIWSNAHYQQSTPRMELPDFYGNYSKWISFKDLFLETIHNNPTINKAQKMKHLKTKLKGEAESLVQHLSVCAENYNSCWDILVQRYDNRRLQFSSFFNTMMSLPVIHQPDANNLKKMHDVIKECMNGIANIGLDTTTWDPMIVHLMLPKLDSTTLNDYMNEIRDHRELQNLQDFLYFLECKFMAYETAKSTKSVKNTTSEYTSHWKPANNKQPVKKFTYDSKKTYNYHATYGKCPNCNGNHVLMQCAKFINMDTAQRNHTVAKLKLCKNCLYSHNNEECKSAKTCKECNMKHHTMLHNVNWKIPANGKNNFGQQASSSQQQASNHLSSDKTEILLTTTLLKIKAYDGTYVKLRALLDQGSQVNLITENAAQVLRLPRKRFAATISGVGSVSGDCRGQLNLSCKSINSEYDFEIQALIMKKLTNNLPNATFEKSNWPHLENLKLADPDFNISRPIDLLLGADVYSDIILNGVLKGSCQSPVAQQTHLGWILCGKMKTFNCHVTLVNFDELTKYWESEEIQNSEDISKDDQCEQFYSETVQRAPDGKYIVKMPLRPDLKEKLGSSRPIAVSQFLQLEKRLAKNKKLSTMYKEFIREYADLGHMKLSPHITSTDCYLPHHGVLKESSTTTKLRVVFNASQKTSSGHSLNSLLEKGPNLQKDIQSLILKWRTYKFAFTADIEKMYRCVWINDDQQHLQKIIWRDSPEQPLQEYKLCTVTYGTKPAPWLALRTLKQLAIDEGHKYPTAAAEVLENHFFVDDLVSGERSFETAKELQRSLIDLLKGAGMNLRKWSSNYPTLLEDLPKEQISTTNSFDFKIDETSKTLGLTWNTNSDTFHLKWPVKQSTKQLTKRLLLSEISKFYDPLGWLSPVTITAKLLFQKVWTLNIDWDDEIPQNIEKEWQKLKIELPFIRNITLKRWIGETKQDIELLGFCDASEKAYACVIYSRVTNSNEVPVITLLVSRTRVAPIAQKTTLPRLELCGALLLAKLMEKTQKALSEYNLKIQAWCDSQVVLAWLQGDTTKREAYISNRVTKIKRIIPTTQWRYIKSEHNPADCASRGMLPSKLITFDLWFQGPAFLKKIETDETANYKTYHTNISCKEKENQETSSNHEKDNWITTLLNKCSSLTKLFRVTAWILRCITNMSAKRKSEAPYLTTTELTAARKIIIKHIQQIQFNQEYKQLLKNENVSKRSAIMKLNPYLDEDKIIRVGGRLQNSNLPAEMKNPIIIPHKGRLTQLLIEYSHLTTLHGGARLTLTYIRQRYWIVGGNRAVKTQLRKCVRCHRFTQTDNHQLMSNLPQQRVTPCRPFTFTGVDYSGYIELKINKGRGVKTSKGYIAIFICMATKAVHIELVSDLGTETFIAAFQRLCARRGTPKHMYSDCGTNFIGAAKVLGQEFKNFKQIMTPEFFDELAKLEVEWHFNAPAWPSAGGLWEAAVKSMKRHLRRVLGDQKLTYEEMSTLLTKIEACLNSRPLCPLTEDPEEFYNCLTPGHFITGGAIMTLPLSDYTDVHIGVRRRWQLVEQMLQQYWKNWSNEYLTQLQTRSKWNKPTKNINVGDIVLVKDNNLPPGKWALGRVLETHPGSDGYVRVTTIKTRTGVTKRPVTKLSPLPLASEIENQGDPTTKEEQRSNFESKNKKGRN